MTWRTARFGLQAGIAYQNAFEELWASLGAPQQAALLLDDCRSDAGAEWQLVLAPGTPNAFERLASEPWQPLDPTTVERWVFLIGHADITRELGIQIG